MKRKNGEREVKIAYIRTLPCLCGADLADAEIDATTVECCDCGTLYKLPELLDMIDRLRPIEALEASQVMYFNGDSDDWC